VAVAQVTQDRADRAAEYPAADEPSPEEFRAAEADLQVAQVSRLGRVVRMVGVLFLVLALLAYFATPYGRIVTTQAYRWLKLPPQTHTIPLAPEHRAGPHLVG